MPVVAAFAVVLLIMGVVVAFSVAGDRKRRANQPPPVPRPVPPDYPTGIHLRWANRPYPSTGSPTSVDPFQAGGASVGPGGVEAAVEAAARSDHRTAAEQFRKLLAAAVEAGQPAAPLRHALAESLIEIGAYHEAEDVLHDGLAALSAAEEPFRGDLVSKQGEVAWALGELERAEMLLESAAASPCRLTSASWIQMHLGLVERDRGRLSVARQLMLTALEDVERSQAGGRMQGAAPGPEPDQARDDARDTSRKLLLILLASISIRAGELDDADHELAVAAALVRDHRFLAPYGRLVSASLQRARGNGVAAVEEITAARSAFEALGLPPYMAMADVDLAHTSLDLGRIDDARTAYWRAVWAYDSFGCVGTVQRLRDEVTTLPG